MIFHVRPGIFKILENTLQGTTLLYRPTPFSITIFVHMSRTNHYFSTIFLHFLNLCFLQSIIRKNSFILLDLSILIRRLHHRKGCRDYRKIQTCHKPQHQSDRRTRIQKKHISFFDLCRGTPSNTQLTLIQFVLT